MRAAHAAAKAAALKLLFSAAHWGVHLAATHWPLRAAWTLLAKLTALAATLTASLRVAGSAHWPPFNLNSHFARPAAMTRVPLAAAVLGPVVGILQFDDVLALWTAGLSKGGGGQEA